MKLVDVGCRHQATVWSATQLGLPSGFAHMQEYIEYVDDLMDDSGYEEMWLMDDDGSYHAYVAFCLGRDAHHKGDIFDVTNVVIRPGSNCASTLWRMMVDLAKANDCQWISRCSHEPDGTVRNYYRRIKHG